MCVGATCFIQRGNGSVPDVLQDNGSLAVKQEFGVSRAPGNKVVVNQWKFVLFG